MNRLHYCITLAALHLVLRQSHHVTFKNLFFQYNIFRHWLDNFISLEYINFQNKLINCAAVEALAVYENDVLLTFQIKK